MRTWVTVSQDGVMRAYYMIKVETLPDGLQLELAVPGLEKLTKTYTDGREVAYSAIEYECAWCGQYGHTDAECILREADGCPND